jgi:hypothetical protein
MKKFLLGALLVFPFVAVAEPAIILKTLPTISCSTVDSQILAVNKYRRYLEIINRGSVTVYIKQDSAVSTTEGIAIAAGATWLPRYPLGNSFHCLAASSTASLTVLEGQ